MLINWDNKDKKRRKEEEEAERLKQEYNVRLTNFNDFTYSKRMAINDCKMKLSGLQPKFDKETEMKQKLRAKMRKMIEKSGSSALNDDVYRKYDDDLKNHNVKYKKYKKQIKDLENDIQAYEIEIETERSKI